MKLHFEWQRLESLTAAELYALLQARESVFVVEQQCAYQEADGMDFHAWHLRVLLDGELAACARVVDPGLKYTEPSIGRVMTLGKFRKLQIGRALVAEAIAFTEQHWPGQGIRIGAQAHLEGFYGSLGFQAVGDVYDEDGIPHIDMVKPAQA
ncbi:GNAT family N-acetyltransferase [Comamonas sp. GB3 AK4-5]|uniref:GNAT family N-acetyltransferase n=1 Tax=Comamonas sp. GB3 AK4-5 TaxID=3231487 RepID=UPI00351EF9E2